MNDEQLQGVLCIDKPSGWTSFDVVNYVRKLVAQASNKKPRNCKVGHTGTLDPLATGLLVLLVGKRYTRAAQSLSKQDKTYEVTVRLGQTSTTGDNEGDKTAVSNREPSLPEVTEALKAFTGHIMQTPPAFSAMKINGVRAYALARQGKPVTLEARPVTIYSSDLTAYTYPLVQFTCVVSSGTYIRSLAEDIGAKLGVGAYMSDLRRTTLGTYVIEDAITPSSLDIQQLQAHLRQDAVILDPTVA